MMMLPTTTVTITKPDGDGDPYEPAGVTTVASGVAAHVSAPTGSDARIGGDQEIVDAFLFLDVAPVLDRTMRVVDDGTGDVYAVTWVRRRSGLGLDHQKAGLVSVKGGANG